MRRPPRLGSNFLYYIFKKTTTEWLGNEIKQYSLQISRVTAEFSRKVKSGKHARTCNAQAVLGGEKEFHNLNNKIHLFSLQNKKYLD